jgi:predicted ferric reductase
MGFVLLSSVASVRQRAYEIFHKLHLILATILIVAIYLHSKSKELWTPPTVYLLAAIFLQILMGVLRSGEVLYRNVKYGKLLSRAIVRPITFKRSSDTDIPVTDAVHVHVQLSRSWRPRGGQYAYLCIPGVSYSSFVQWHAFYVSWWYRDAEGNDVVVFIVQKQRGFSRNLFLHANSDLSQNYGMRALVKGPYGKELDLKSYGTFLLFATGIGISGQLPYVTQLLEGYHNCEVKARRIALFWELESECKLLHLGGDQ